MSQRREAAIFLFSAAFVLGAAAIQLPHDEESLGRPRPPRKLAREMEMTNDLQPTQPSMRRDGLFVLAVFALALAVAAYLANPTFAAQVDHARAWVTGLFS